METWKEWEIALLKRVKRNGTQNRFALRILHIAPQFKNLDQRENIFQTKCKIGNNICDLIIDGGSESNCVSRELVKNLGLATIPPP